MTNRAAIFERSIKCSPSAVLVAMLLMNPPVDASVGTTSTTKGYSFSRGLVVCCLSSCGSKDRCGEFRPYVSQDLSWSRSFTRSIGASLTVIYYAGAGVVPKSNRRQMMARSSTIAMHVDAVVLFTFIRR